jgi:hypothetical protein
MPSIGSSVANTRQGAKFFVVVVQALTEDILTATGATLTSANLLARLAPGAVLRDLGTTVRIPANLQTGTTQETLREVQLIDPSALSALATGGIANFVNFNEGVGGLPSFYVRILPSTVSGGNPFIASLNI